MEFSKEETNPLMFGYWGNKSFQEWLCYICYSLYFDSKKNKYDIFYLVYLNMSFGENVYLDYEYLLVTMINIYTKRLVYLRHE